MSMERIRGQSILVVRNVQQISDSPCWLADRVYKTNLGDGTCTGALS